MSDTRAAIRELRSLSEKRSLSALTEAEAARWMALRRQLGLPLEPETVGSSPTSPTPAGPAPLSPPTPPVPDAVLAGAAGTTPDEPAAQFWDAEEATNASQPVSPDDEPEPEETHWNGPSLDSPAAPTTSAWVGPALDAPAWSDAAADRPTDPGLDGPPPAPFDEAPAATRPQRDAEATEFGGSPADRVPLAAAADFVSYGRQGDEGIDLPPDTGGTDDIEHQSLANLASAPSAERAQASERDAPPTAVFDADEGGLAEDSHQLSASASAAPSVHKSILSETRFQLEAPVGVGPDLLEAVEQQTAGLDEGVLPEAPVPLQAAGPQTAGMDEGVLPEAPAPLDAAGPQTAGMDEGVLPEAPAPLEAEEQQTAGLDEGVLPEAPAPLQAAEQQTAGMDEGVLPEAPAPLEAAGPQMAGMDEGVLPEAPAPLEAAQPESPDMGVLPEPSVEHDASSAQARDMNEGVLPEALHLLESSTTEAQFVEETVFPGTPPPLQLGTPLSHALQDATSESAHTGLAGVPVEPLPPAPSTWEPGAAEPPRLAGDDFARGGDPLSAHAPDPWPEETSLQTDDVVETVGDDDFVEDSTSTPEPPFPVASPPGSGGIRGFQFPKPPPGPSATPVPWQRTEPGVPSFAANAAAPAPIPGSSVPGTTPTPSAQRPRPVAVVVPVPPAPPSRSVTPTALAPKTPLPQTQPSRPIPAAAVAPVTPEPTSRPAIPVSRPSTAEVPTLGGSETAGTGPSAYQPRTPLPAASRSLAAVEEETVQPVLELVDEVEPPQAAVPKRNQPTPSPATGTQAVFGAPMMLNPSIVEGDHRVVVHTLEGQVHRGTVHDLDLQEDALAVQQPDGRSVHIPTKRVKAVFFVLAPGGTPLATRGERVQVTFRDGRQVVGYSDDHASGEPGFFVVPTDARTNTARVYVFRGGVQSITTG